MKVEVRDTDKKGKGIFALKDFKKGEQILYFSGKIVKVDDESKYPEHVREHWHPIDENTYILPESPWTYLNHSCEPNAGVKNDRYLVAIRDIKKDEEILIDYSTLFLEGWSMKCHCGTKNCRKTISTFDKLNSKDQKRLKNYVSNYVRKKYL